MKKLLKKILRSKGYIPVKPIQHSGQIAFNIQNLAYDHVSPIANFSPWRNDKEFLEVYDIIRNFTLVDIYRSYELWQLVDETVSLGEGYSFLEVGVWRGGTAGIISGKLLSLNANSKLYLADTFSGVVKATQKDDFYKGDEHNDTNQEIVEDLLSNKLKFHNYRILKGIFPDDTGMSIPQEEKFCFCHIDVDVYQSGSDIINWIWDRLVIGGVLVFDDYGFHWCTGITKLVDEQRSMSDRIVIHNLNGHALIVKIR